jgi:hypothetical protein
MSERVGLIAGRGRLPILVAEGMRRAGLRVCAVGLRDQFHPDLPAACDEFAVAGITRLGRWIRVLRRAGVEQAVMIGGVAKTRMHDPLRWLRYFPDLRAINLWYRRLRHDRRDAAVLAAVADELARSGITLIDSTTHIGDHLATEGTLTRTAPTAAQSADIAFGWSLVQQLADLGIGQAMAVRDRDVLAVEAIEGTDRMIDRAGELCRASGWTLLKTAATGHDMRADVPTIGVETVERLARCGGGCIAVAARCVILVDRPAVIAAAERAGIAIVGRGR